MKQTFPKKTKKNGRWNHNYCYIRTHRQLIFNITLVVFLVSGYQKTIQCMSTGLSNYWLPQKLQQIYTAISVLGRLRDLQHIFAVVYKTLCTDVRGHPHTNMRRKVWKVLLRIRIHIMVWDLIPWYCRTRIRIYVYVMYISL